MSQDTANEKWVEISAWGLLFADGKCTDSDSKTATRHQVEAVGKNACILEFKPYYFNNVYLLEYDDETVTVKVGGETAKLKCGEEFSHIEPLDYAYSKTSVKLWSQSGLEEARRKRQERERAEKEKEERRKRPFNPDDFDWYEDEFKRRDYVKALLKEMEDSTDELWPEVQAKVWENKKVFRSWEAVKAANICFYPKYGHVDIDAAQQWYLLAKDRLPVIKAMCDLIPQNKDLINENLARILYIKGKPEEAEKIVEEGLEKDKNKDIEAWRIEYRLLCGEHLSPQELETLIEDRNVAALNRYLRFKGPRTREEYNVCSTEERAQINQICDALLSITEYQPESYSAYAYPAMWKYLHIENNDFWDDEISERLVEGKLKDNIECCFYLGFTSWHAADLILSCEGSERYEEVMGYVIENFRIVADLGDALSCKEYALALEQIHPDSPEIQKYMGFWKRLSFSKS